jgi:hypothetical protein
MCLTGAPLWVETFRWPDFPKEWHKGKGTRLLETGSIMVCRSPRVRAM